MEDSSLRKWHPLEYAHVFLWLIKDMCWAMQWKVMGSIMVIPTVLAAFYITWIQKRQTVTLVHNLAISIWITANSNWMLAEFFGKDETLKPWSMVGFAAGLGLLLCYYGYMLAKKRPSF